jgi:antitoxin component YwqK of YwqJK toxin-antitoxin module
MTYSLFFILIPVCFLNQLFAQEIVGMKDLYADRNLVYKSSNDELFSGQAQSIRNNGHLVYEEYFTNGELIKSIMYYNSTDKPIPSSITEFYVGTKNKRKVTNFGLKKPTTESIHFDIHGKKILVERRENEKLTYRCEFLKNKKHGMEYCLNKDGAELKIEFRNGKKIKRS